jgi:hypothetical protein
VLVEYNQETAMARPLVSLVFGAMLLASGASAQQTDKPFDFKPLIPPVFPVPPNSSVTSGAVGGSQNPYTTAPLQSPSQGTSQPAPGMRLTIPTR